MRILILGAAGIAGSALMRAIPGARGATRGTTLDARIIPGVDIANRSDIERAFDIVRPEVVVNCAGIVKSECDKQPPGRVCAVNLEAPHTIAKVAHEFGCRVVHLSTDCVFDGSRGGRMETETPDATDLYGQSKAAGELATYGHCLTIRTSFIGRDPTYGRGLLEWLFEQRDEIAGYAKMKWSGLTAAELARVIVAHAIPSGLSGIYHVSGPVISKAELLDLLIEAHDLPIHVRYANEPRIDRTLDDSKFRQATGYTAPTWIAMATELARDGCPVVNGGE